MATDDGASFVSNWVWTYHRWLEPITATRYEHVGRRRKAVPITIVGAWTNNDERDWYGSIRLDVTDDERFHPWVPYWDGFREPSWGSVRDGFSLPDGRLSDGSFEMAIAYCESYLARDTRYW